MVKNTKIRLNSASTTFMTLGSPNFGGVLLEFEKGVHSQFTYS